MEYPEELEMYLEVWQKANEQFVKPKKVDIENKVSKNETALKRQISGEVTESVIREHLIKHGLNISERRIYIRGLGIEIDLASLRAGVDVSKRDFGPEEIDAILEIKNTGVANQSSGIRLNIQKIRAIANSVKFVTIVLSERYDYPTQISEKEIGVDMKSKVFTLLGRKRHINPYLVLKREILEEYQRKAIKVTGDWTKAIDFLSTVTGR